MNDEKVGPDEEKETGPDQLQPEEQIKEVPELPEDSETEKQSTTSTEPPGAGSPPQGPPTHN